MSKTAVNILITIFIVVAAGGFLLWSFFPMAFVFTGNLIYLILISGVIILFIYGLYKLVSFINK